MGKDLNEAVRWYRHAADQGLPVALYNLAKLSRQGTLPELAKEDWPKLYELAAERGDYQAAAALGQAHAWGGVPHGRLELGVYWLTVAAKNGNAAAYSNVGWLYMNSSIGVPQDYAEARRWFEKGAQEQEPYCWLGLGMYELAINKSAPDLGKARSWMLKAAEKNIPPAFFQLGRLSELRDIAHGSEVKPAKPRTLLRDFKRLQTWMTGKRDWNSRDDI